MTGELLLGTIDFSTRLTLHVPDTYEKKNDLKEIHVWNKQDVAGGGWLGVCVAMTTKWEATPHPHNTPTPHKPLSTPSCHHHLHKPFRQHGKTVASRNDEGPLEARIYSSTKTDLPLSTQYSYCLSYGAYGEHANSLQTSAIHFSPQPHKPIVLGEMSMAATLSLALPFSSSLFDSEESGRGSERNFLVPPCF